MGGRFGGSQMFKQIARAAAVAVIVFGFTAAANATSPRDRTTLAVVGTGVGTGMGAANLALNDWRFTHWDSARHGITALGAWGLTTMGCAALSPIIATAVLNRPLTYREAHILIGGCVIPIIGGWLVDQAYENHILWAPDEPQQQVRVAKRHPHHR
jgi:hypothetical protein